MKNSKVYFQLSVITMGKYFTRKKLSLQKISRIKLPSNACASQAYFLLSVITMKKYFTRKKLNLQKISRIKLPLDVCALQAYHLENER